MSDTNISKLELTERIKKYIPDFVVNQSDYYEDPDKRDYIVSNEKIESVGWKSNYSLDDGIQELISGYQIIINNDLSKFQKWISDKIWTRIMNLFTYGDSWTAGDGISKHSKSDIVLCGQKGLGGDAHIKKYNFDFQAD